MGTRRSEETYLKPKRKVEIGGRPTLCHVMEIYSAHGINDFIICVGYKGYVIKEYFANIFPHMSDVTFDMQHNRMEVHEKHAEPWRVTVVDTGEDTMAGGRRRRVKSCLDDGTFCFRYGDGFSDVDITRPADFHRREGRQATLTAVQPPGRCGALQIEDTAIRQFHEKPADDGGWIMVGSSWWSRR